MSEMKIPKDSLSATPQEIPATGSKDVKQTPAAVDSLEAMSTGSQGALSLEQISVAPQLAMPEGQVSLQDFWKVIMEASSAFRQQLAASDKMDLDLRQLSTSVSADQALMMQNLMDQRAKALDQLASDSQQIAEEIEKKIAEMQKEQNLQQDQIDQLNQGNASEKKHDQDLANAYQKYLDQLKDLGVEDQGNGSYLVPEGAEKEYNAITADYQAAVGKFNAFWNKRQTEIDAYNKATVAYNQSAAENNEELNALIDKYNLSNAFSVPTQGRAQLRDMSGAPSEIPAPDEIETTPTTISLPSLNSFIVKIGKNGLAALPALKPISSIDEQVILKDVTNALYQQRVAGFDQAIKQLVLYWQFTQASQTVQNKYSDPTLNSKPMAERILPEATITLHKKIVPVTESESTPPLQTLGVDNSQLATLLGEDLLKQAIKEMNFNAVKNKENKKVDEQKVEKLVDRLLILSIGLMGNQTVRALFPSISPIASLLPNLPSDSPAYALLFALSFANRVQENVNQGISQEALQTFLSEIPEFKNLTNEDQTKLEAALNVGQLMVAVKMIETAVGMPGLSAAVIAPLISLDPETIVSEGEEERKPVLEKLQQTVKEKFIAEGFSEEEADFIGQFGVELSKAGVLTPAAAAIPTPAAIQKPLLINSIKTALILNKVPLKKAEAVAQEAVEEVLKDTPYPSTKQLRVALVKHLQDLGVREKAPDIARMAVIVPPQLKLQEVATAEKGPVAEPEKKIVSEKPAQTTKTPEVATAQKAPVPEPEKKIFSEKLAQITKVPEAITPEIAPVPEPEKKIVSEKSAPVTKIPEVTIAEKASVSEPEKSTVSEKPAQVTKVPEGATTDKAVSEPEKKAVSEKPVRVEKVPEVATPEIAPLSKPERKGEKLETPAVAPAPKASVPHVETSPRPVPTTPKPIPTATPKAGPKVVGTSTSVPVTKAQPPLKILQTVLHERVRQLLTPQLGEKVTKEVIEELSKTLFGTAVLTDAPLTEVKSPYSVVNVLKNQLATLHVGQDQQWTEAVTETFKETIKTMENFYAFSLKLMSPAYSLTFSSFIYGDLGRKKGIDIQI